MFRTPIKIQPSDLRIDHKNKLLSLGSCFAQNSGQKLLDYKFDALVNPFGTIFNPPSIFKLIRNTINEVPPCMVGITQVQDVFHHFDFHSDLSDITDGGLMEQLFRKQEKVKSFISKTDILILTFGTSIIYQRKDTGEVVSNCHKMPSDFFDKRFLDINEITEEFDDVYKNLKHIRPDLKCILTVSPVRHIKDSFEKNNISKSILRLATDRLVSSHKDVYYFPSYEIMMDDLRDYRYYADDMVHPADLAVNYIWDRFMETYMTDVTRNFISKWHKIRKSVYHRPFFPQTQAHQTFVRKTIEQVLGFKDMVDVNQELEILKSQIV